MQVGITGDGLETVCDAGRNYRRCRLELLELSFYDVDDITTAFVEENDL